MSDVRVSTVTSSARGLLSNTHLVDAPDGVVVVDPPMLVSDARKVCDEIDRRGRRLSAFVYTHPHPDHVNGTTEIRGRLKVPVYATPDTDRVSRAIDGPERASWTPVFGADYPTHTTFATDLVPGGESVVIAGLPFTVHDLGAGECATAAAWVTGDVAFVGDLVYSRVHPWLFEARVEDWLAQLDRARPLVAGKNCYVGHGVSGGASLLDDQAHYIRAYVDAVNGLSQGRSRLDEQAKAKLVRRMAAFWPGAPLTDLVALSADPIAARLTDSAVRLLGSQPPVTSR